MDGRTMRRRGRLATALLVAATVVVAPSVAGATGARDISTACSGAPEDGFIDVGADGTALETAIDCIAWYAITGGTGGSSYSPSATISRGQLASMVAASMRASETDFAEPSPSEDRFPDDDGSVHEANIDFVAKHGIVSGMSDGSFRPTAGVTRGQMATFLVNQLRAIGAAVSPSGTDHFSDDDGTTHEGNINALADLGIASGTGAGAFSPQATLTRGQMALFVARDLSYLVEQKKLVTPVAKEPLAAPTGVTATDPGNDGGDRLAVSWAAVSDPNKRLASYNVYANGTKKGTAQAGTTSTTLTGLTPDTEYTVTVTSVTVEGLESTPSSGAKATPVNERPLDVGAFSASPRDNAVVLNWLPSGAPDIAGYEVARFDAGAVAQCDPTQTQYKALATASGGSNSEYVDATAKNDNNYCYRIIAVDSAGQKSEKPAYAGPAKPGVGIPSVTIQAPAGGERFRFSQPVEMKWTATDTDGALSDLDVRIRLVQYVAPTVTSISGDVLRTATIYDSAHGASAVATFPWGWKYTDGTWYSNGGSNSTQIRITVTDADGKTSETTSAPFRITMAPDIVSGLTALNEGNAVALAWTPVAQSEVRYRIESARVEILPNAKADDPRQCDRVAEEENPIAKEQPYYEPLGEPVAQSTSPSFRHENLDIGNPAGTDYRYCYRVIAESVHPVLDKDQDTTNDQGAEAADFAYASANPTLDVASVSLKRPNDNEEIPTEKDYPISYAVSTPGTATVARLAFFYCVDYQKVIESDPTKAQDPCRSGWQPAAADNSARVTEAGEGVWNWKVPPLAQVTGVTGAVQVRLYETEEHFQASKEKGFALADDLRKSTDVATGIRFR